MGRDRATRLRKIVEIVSTRAIATQQALAAALADEGWEVTQSSVSRDIAALGLVKVDGAYRRQRGALSSERRTAEERVIAESVTGVDEAGDCLLVLHTPPGEANRVAVAIDRLAWPELAGTLAGDDTIFVAARASAARRRAFERIGRLAGRVRARRRASSP